MTVAVEIHLRATGAELRERDAKKIQGKFCGGVTWEDRPFCVRGRLVVSAWARDGVLHFYMRPLGARARELKSAVKWFVEESYSYGARTWEGSILLHGVGEWLQSRVIDFLRERWRGVGYDVTYDLPTCFLRVDFSPALANRWDLYGTIYRMAQRYSLLVRPLRALGIRCETIQ